MLAVVATLGIVCGTDSILMLYGREKGRWRELMVRRARPYSEVKGGWADLRFAVSPKDRQGRWFVATVSVTPWCTSAWQGLPYELARPGPAPDRPNVFFRGKGYIYLGNEEDLLLRAEADAFELRHDDSSLDPAVHNRRHVRRYQGERRQGAPSPAGGGECARLRRRMDRLSLGGSRSLVGGATPASPDPCALQAKRYELLGEFASIRACGDGVIQVEISREGEPGWYFLARGGESGPWILERVERRPEAACAGPDLLKREAD